MDQRSIEPIKILIVNEDENDFNITKNQFSETSYSKTYVLYWCDSYEKAINAMLKSHYDIYLVYYRIGKYTGVELLNEAIKSNVAEPVIIVTGSEDHNVDEEALQKGASAYLLKGKIDVFSLERSVRYALHHKKNLQQLKQSENKYRIFFEKSPDPILITDGIGNIHDINEAGEKFFGISRLYLLKYNVNDFYKNLSDRISFINEIEKSGTVKNFVVEVIAANGEIKNCSISSFLQISQHGENELFHSVIHDITHVYASFPQVNHASVS
ncbi:MAG TPA: PAS domain S-box protein [Sphingobacteriaceae bacterium]|nr:PAS domain S-box protein [Sphingobacteriaceae bacterium]